MKNTFALLLFCCFSFCFFFCTKEMAVDIVPQKYRQLEKIATMGGGTEMLNNASGSIGITNRDFNKIPSGAHVSFVVGRGDYVAWIRICLNAAY